MDKNKINIIKNNISTSIYNAMPSSTTTQSRYSKQIKKMQDKINKLENDISRIEQNKPAFSFSKINSKTLKNIGFKSKTIAKK